MALTPEGTPYVESSDLVANYPAASLSLANRVDLVGVLPFATSAARATAIPSPTDGQYTYLQDTNSTEFWNGSVWVATSTPGLSMVNPTTIANSGGTSSATGGQVTFTTVNSISLNGVFSATYDYYQILCNLTGTNNTGVTLRLRVAGVDASGSNYVRQLLEVTGATVVGARSTSTSATMGGVETTSFSQFNSTVFNPFLTVPTKISSLADTGNVGAYLNVVVNGHSLTTSYDGFTILPVAGTITGTIRVYGYKNS